MKLSHSFSTSRESLQHLSALSNNSLQLYTRLTLWFIAPVCEPPQCWSNPPLHPSRTSNTQTNRYGGVQRVVFCNCVSASVQPAPESHILLESEMFPSAFPRPPALAPPTRNSIFWSDLHPLQITSLSITEIRLMRPRIHFFTSFEKGKAENNEPPESYPACFINCGRTLVCVHGPN